MPPPLFQSIQARVLILVVVLMIGVTSLLSWYTLRQFEAATTFELEQEGLLLSNALEASIAPSADRRYTRVLNAVEDRLMLMAVGELSVIEYMSA